MIKRGWRLGVATFLALCFNALPAAAQPPGAPADETAPFERTLETSAAIVHFHPEDELLARRIADGLDYARVAVAASFGEMRRKVVTYVYRSNPEMAAGLRDVLGYEKWEVDAILRVGISACTQGSLHIHRRIGSWGNLLQHALADEYVHGVIEERFGTAPARSATWIEEGLTSVVAGEALAEKLAGFEDWYSRRNRNLALEALQSGRFPRFAAISTREQWYTNITRSRATWQDQYAAAFVGVLFIVERHGFEAVERILGGIEEGQPYAMAIQNELGLSLQDLEAQVHAWLSSRPPRASEGGDGSSSGSP